MPAPPLNHQSAIKNCSPSGASASRVDASLRPPRNAAAAKALHAPRCRVRAMHNPGSDGQCLGPARPGRPALTFVDVAFQCRADGAAAGASAPPRAGAEREQALEAAGPQAAVAAAGRSGRAGISSSGSAG
jgi:hypothetical protein